MVLSSLFLDACSSLQYQRYLNPLSSLLSFTSMLPLTSATKPLKITTMSDHNSTSGGMAFSTASSHGPSSSILVRLRIVLPGDNNQVAFDVNLEATHVASLNSLTHFINEQLSCLSQSYRVVEDSLAVEWEGDNASDVIETLDRLWLRNARAILRAEAVPDSENASIAQGGPSTEAEARSPDDSGAADSTRKRILAA